MNAHELVDLLLNEANVLLYGPPGTGKTHLVQETAALLSGEDGAAALIALDTGREHQFLQAYEGPRCRVFWVTFHQDYSYDNFVIGLRPDLNSERLLALRPEPGVLLNAAAHALIPGNISLIIIDEINRGNVGRIFGDFVTFMEADKRLDDHGRPTQGTVHVTLPYLGTGEIIPVDLEGFTVRLGNPFAMPRRVYTLATMNSIDRTAAPLDAAIRRRFRMVNLNVDRVAIATALGIDAEMMDFSHANLETVDGVKILAGYLLEQINIRIQWFLGRDFQLGQWYLAPLVNVVEPQNGVNALSNIWSGRVWPQLEESFALNPEQLTTTLGLNQGNVSNVLILSSPDEAASEIGALSVPTFRSSADPQDIVRALYQIAERFSQ